MGSGPVLSLRLMREAQREQRRSLAPAGGVIPRAGEDAVKRALSDPI